jgi:hypothetical protein
MLLEQAQQQHQHGNNLLAALGTGNNLQPYWGFPPPPYPTTPHPQAHSVTAGKAHDDPSSNIAPTVLVYFLINWTDGRVQPKHVVRRKGDSNNTFHCRRKYIV